LWPWLRWGNRLWYWWGVWGIYVLREMHRGYAAAHFADLYRPIPTAFLCRHQSSDQSL
jgi:hypothetical protein